MNFDCDIIIVGLGPVGDVLAGLLQLEGAKVVAIERDLAPYPLPRAAQFDDEVMRIFQRLGISDQLEQLCRTPDRYEFLSAAGDLLLDFPIRGEPTISGWEQGYVLHQPAVEAALRGRLAELGVDLRLGHRLTALQQSEQAVVATIGGPDGAYELSARYLVGADGAGSVVRQLLGVALFDYSFDEPWLVIDALVPETVGVPDRVMQICDPVRPSTYLKMTGERVRWEFMMLPGETAEEVTASDMIARLLAPWNLGDDWRIERQAVYRFHGLVAERWRDGRVLLAGDAAHQMPPFAGQGMCSGIRDAGNLAWKLGCVLRGEASASLLDTYQAEREPHARATIETAIAMGKVICLTDPHAAAARDADMLARRAAGGQDISIRYPDLAGGCLDTSPGAGGLFPQWWVGGRRLDDILGHGFWLIGRDLPTGIPAWLAAIDLNQPEFAAFTDAISAWLDQHDAPAVLVRPDRHVFGTGSAAALIASLMERGSIAPGDPIHRQPVALQS